MTQDTQKKVAIGGFLVLAAGILYYQLRDDSPPPRPAQPVITTAPEQASARQSARTSGGADARNLGTTSAQLDPTLKWLRC